MIEGVEILCEHTQLLHYMYIVYHLHLISMEMG